MNLISATLGRIAPSFRTLSEWADIYTPGLSERQVCKKTLQNRQCHVRRIVEALGDKRIGAIKPHEISSLIARVSKEHPVAAKRTLIEIRSMMDEAVNNGWITTNPAKAVRRVDVVALRGGAEGCAARRGKRDVSAVAARVPVAVGPRVQKARARHANPAGPRESIDDRPLSQRSRS